MTSNTTSTPNRANPSLDVLERYWLQQIALGGKEVILESAYIPNAASSNSSPSGVSKELTPATPIAFSDHTNKNSSDSDSLNLFEQLQQKLNTEVSPPKKDASTEVPSISQASNPSKTSLSEDTPKPTKQWDTFQEYYAHLEQSGLYANHTVVQATGNTNAPIAVLSMAPEQEDTDRMFQGSVGELWGKMLNAIQVDATQTYTTSLVKNSSLSSSLSWRDRNKHLPYLLQELQEVNPKLILLLGEDITQVLLKTGSSLKQLRQQPLSLPTFSHIQDPTSSVDSLKHSTTLYVLQHPSALLQHPERKRDAWEDLQWIQKNLPQT